MKGIRRRRGSSAAIVATIIGCGAWPLVAAADGEGGRDNGAARFSATKTQAAGAAGAFLPFSQVASVENQHAWTLGLAGYDSARHIGTFEASTEVRMWGPIALRGGAVYANSDRKLRPSFGARVQVFREERQGMDGAIGVFYRPEGLTEPEGEIESVLSIGRHMGQTYLLANLLYGQDPEGNERDGEVRLAATRPIASRFLIGIDGRLRFDLGSNAGKLAQHHEPTMDGVVGPSVTVFFGPLALMLQAGGGVLRFQQTTSYGALAMIGVGTAL